MKEIKLVILLKSLSSDDFRWFYKFVRSPYHNANKHLVKLYELLKKYYPDFEHPKLTQELIYDKLFPGETYDVQRIRLLFHRLANLVESFLATQELKKDEFLYKKLVTKSFGRINTYNLFEKKTSSLLKELETSPFRDETFFKNKEELSLQFYAHPATNRQKNATTYLADAMESLDSYFILSKVKLACALRARVHTLSEQYDIQYMDIAIEKKQWSNLLISIYSKIIELQDAEEDVNVFGTIRALFISNLDAIPKEDQRNILHLLINFCTRLINKGVSGFIRKMLELYKIGLKSDCLLVNNELSETTFNNIVTTGTGCEEFEWTKLFIEQYGEHLNDNVRGDAIAYSFAILHFRQNELEETIQILINHSFTKPLQIILSKTLLIRTYVELFLKDNTYFELSIAQINTFEKYIRNNTGLPERTMNGYLNFMKFTKKMIHLKGKNKETTGLITKVQLAENVRLKNWLLEKLEIRN